jgi:dipeptide/tripeptide permease
MRANRARFISSLAVLGSSFIILFGCIISLATTPYKFEHNPMPWIKFLALGFVLGAIALYLLPKGHSSQTLCQVDNDSGSESLKVV